MCIIISKPAGIKRLDPAYFNRAWEKNPDGGGLVWKKPDEEVYFQKGFMNKQEFLNKIDELNQDDTAFIAHFRIKSVGAICPENTHPFPMDHVTYAHNGTLGIKPFEGKTDSETFGLCFLKDKPMSWIKEYQVLLEMALGTSKFAIMDNQTGEILVLNPELGEEKDGAWFSNKSAFETPKPVWSGYNYSKYKNDFDDYSSPNLLGYQATKIKGQLNWGTKAYNREYAFVNENQVWAYQSNKTPVWVPHYAKCALHKRGFIIIDPRKLPPEEAEAKNYPKGCPEIKVAEAMTRELYSEVKRYKKTTFNSIALRAEAEYDLSAMYTVIRAMYSFIRNKKKIDDKEFLSFCLDNTEPDANVAKGSAARAYSEFVQVYAFDVLEKLEKAYAKKA